jgi:hypothetical protein
MIKNERKSDVFAFINIIEKKMVVVKITSLLANQMFAYASVKSICEDKGYDFKYIHEHCRASEESFSSVDKKYGKDFDSIFSIPEKERLTSFDNGKYPSFIADDYISKYDSEYYPEALEISDDTFMIGHFLAPKYFIHRIDEVREWFNFPEDINNRANSIIDKIRCDNPKKKIVSVHFRVGGDYKTHGFLIDKNYWLDAGKRMTEKYGSIKFVVFCDKKTSFVNKFMNQYDCELVRGSLVEDLCCMTKCDAHILSNSSFSVMGALLNPTKELYVIRPSHFFAGCHHEVKGCFLDEWDVVDSKRDLMSFLEATFKIGGVRNVIYDKFHALKKIIRN